MPSPSNPSSPALPTGLEFVSHGPAGSGPYLMLSALAGALVQAGLSEAPAIRVATELDGAAAIRAVSAGGVGVLGSCTPTYLTTPVVHGLTETVQTLTPIARLVADSYLLVVPAGSVASPSELFSGPTTVAVPKRGGNTDIHAMLIGEATGTEISVLVEHDPAALIEGLVAGRAHWTSGVYSDFAAELAVGRLQVLATFDAEPVPSATASTLREQGVDVVFPLWRGVIGPGGLPEDVVAAWARALTAALEQPAWQEYIARERQRTAYLPAAGFADLLAEEDVRYRHWVSALGS